MNFQTPIHIVNSLFDKLSIDQSLGIFEPTAGAGNISNTLRDRGYRVNTNEGVDFWTIPEVKYSWIIGNPPFSPLSQGVKIFERCFNKFLFRGGNIVMLLPIEFLTNSTARLRKYFPHLEAMYMMDRTVFRGSRVNPVFFHFIRDRSTVNAPEVYLL